jgi:hypothetical protein
MVLDSLRKYALDIRRQTVLREFVIFAGIISTDALISIPVGNRVCLALSRASHRSAIKIDTGLFRPSDCFEAPN